MSLENRKLTSKTNSIVVEEGQLDSVLIEDSYQKTWKSNIWTNLDYSKEHRTILNKLDFCVLVSAMLSTFAKYIDKSNLSSAYVSI